MNRGWMDSQSQQKFNRIQSVATWILVGSCLCSLISANQVPIEEEFRKITCSSAIKLAHFTTQYRLHSHGVTYGTGSGQQSVTGFPQGDDPNSYWLVKSAFGTQDCLRGEPVKCDGIVRLKHLATGKMLHSHLHTSPLSGNQEVSAYQNTDTGDNWQIICLKSTTFWHRESPVGLKHVDTGKYLSANQQYQYRSPIPGQLEVSAVFQQSNNEAWSVQEGIFFADRLYAAKDY